MECSKNKCFNLNNIQKYCFHYISRIFFKKINILFSWVIAVVSQLTMFMYFSWVSLYSMFVQCIFQRPDGWSFGGSVSVAIDVTLMIETTGAVQSWRQSVRSPWVPSGIPRGFKWLYKDYNVWRTSLWSLFSNLCLKNTQRLQNSYLSYDCTVWLFKSFKPDHIL